MGSGPQATPPTRGCQPAPSKFARRRRFALRLGGALARLLEARRASDCPTSMARPVGADQSRRTQTERARRAALSCRRGSTALHGDFGWSSIVTRRRTRCRRIWQDARRLTRRGAYRMVRLCDAGVHGTIFRRRARTRSTKARYVRVTPRPRLNLRSMATERRVERRAETSGTRSSRPGPGGRGGSARRRASSASSSPAAASTSCCPPAYAAVKMVARRRAARGGEQLAAASATSVAEGWRFAVEPVPASNREPVLPRPRPRGDLRDDADRRCRSLDTASHQPGALERAARPSPRSRRA